MTKIPLGLSQFLRPTVKYDLGTPPTLQKPLSRTSAPAYLQMGRRRARRQPSSTALDHPASWGTEFLGICHSAAATGEKEGDQSAARSRMRTSYARKDADLRYSYSTSTPRRTTPRCRTRLQSRLLS